VPLSIRKRRPSVITLADQARGKRQWTLAASLYARALEQNFNNPPIWVQYGHALKESGDVAAAESAYRTAISCDPRLADPYIHLGHVLLMQHRDEEAKATYLCALAIDPALMGHVLEEPHRFGWSTAGFNELKVMFGPYMPSPSHGDSAQHAPTPPVAAWSEDKRGAGALAAPVEQRCSNTAAPIACEPRTEPEASLEISAASPDPGWLEADLAAVRNSGLFDEAYYRSQWPDLEGQDPLLHYLARSAREGASPHPLFDRDWYVAGVSHILTTGIDPFVHFVTEGDRKGRSSHPLFDPTFYLHAYPDVATLVAQGMTTPLRHFLGRGGPERRNPHPLFDVAYYYCMNQSIIGEPINPLVHYLLQPRDERRHPHPLLDGHYQRCHSAMVRDTSIDPLVDYVQFRSSLDPATVQRNATSIPKPSRANLPRREPSCAPPDRQPLISVLLPVYNSNLDYLKLAIDSVRAQIYPQWELVIVDDGSPLPETMEFVRKFADADPRIKAVHLAENQGISGASNHALALATGEFVAMLDHDDVLLVDALDYVCRELLRADADACYTDQAYVAASGSFETAFYKPAWSPVMMTGVMFVNHLLVVRRDLAIEVGGFDSRYDKAQDFEFMLRVGERTKKIVHVPRILYHWRRIPGSVAFDAGEKGKIEPIQVAAVNSHFSRMNFPATAHAYPNLVHRLHIQPMERTSYPAVDLVIWGAKDEGEFRACAASLAAHQSTPFASVTRVGIQIAQALAATNNVAASQSAASGDRFVLFADARAQVVDWRWLDYMLLYGELPEIGFVAPHLYTSDGIVVAAGLVVDAEEGFVPAMRGQRFGEDGYAGSLACNREVSALPATWLLAKRSVIGRLGGVDPSFESPGYALGELTYRAAAAGYRNIAVASKLIAVADSYDPLRDSVADRIVFLDKHRAEGDPFYNSNFARRAADYTV
jgi:hypothetical protein